MGLAAAGSSRRWLVVLHFTMLFPASQMMMFPHQGDCIYIYQQHQKQFPRLPVSVGGLSTGPGDASGEAGKPL